ncbi:adenylate kinase 9-like isoform X4 [Apostichopus japonicus]|uniref:adenylate kinase 9-like isoform X4 n=1 Tax=Stichopus japonicus TaxID=307972 RepID=UPI003AB776B9
MAENEQDDVHIEAATPSVTIDMADTRPATQIALDSVTPGFAERGNDGQGGIELSISRALSVSSFDGSHKNSTTNLEPLDTDPFDEDEAELRFLHSKPSCFIILGKPGAGKTGLAKKLAQTWQCQLVNATELILQNIDLQTDLGKKLQELLIKGGVIPEEMAARMIEEKINSPEVTHHGYVIDDLPCMSEEYMNVTDQLALIKNWDLTPDFIINLRIPDKDLTNRRSGQRIDPATNHIYTRELWNPDKPPPKPDQEGEGEEEDGEEEEEEEEDEGEENAGIEEFPDDKPELSAEMIERLVQRPEDLPVHVTESVKIYKEKLLKMFEDYMADHDQQYLIELDANKPVSQLFRELMNRLNTFTLRRAAVPIRLQNQDEEEIPDDIETEELMRTLSGTNMVAPRYRWRRSKWGRACPVELQRGNVVMGKPEFAVGFLDKIYVMSSPDAMEKFLKNPRPFLISPQPRPPCKLCVVGPPLSGKTSNCHLLAQKFNARVLDVNELIKSRYQMHKDKQVELAKKEAIEAAIANVKARLKEKEETIAEDSDQEDRPEDEHERASTLAETEPPPEEEKTPRDTEMENEEEKEAGDTTEQEMGDQTETADDGGGDEEEDNSNNDNKEEEGGAELARPPSRQMTESTAMSQDAPVQSQEPEVDESHPEVQAAAQQAELDADKMTYTLAPEQYVDCLEEAINEVHKEIRKRDPTGPIAGGWIVDNFPLTREHWTVLIDRGLAPDEVVFLKDSSEGMTFLLKRWYHLNKEEVDMKVQLRKEEEDREKARILEEARLQEIREKKEEEERLKALKEAEDGQTADETPRTEPEEEQTEPAVAAPPVEEKAEAKPAPEPALTEATESTVGDSTYLATEKSEVPVENVLPPDGPETQQYKDQRMDFEREWPSVQALLTGTVNLEPLTVEIEDLSIDDVLKIAHNKVEQPYTYRAADYTSMDLDEEDEDAEADEDDEMEEEEDEEVAKNKKKQLGDTKHFCPVAFKENFVLWPGNPEIGSKYRERVYYFSNQDNKDKFLADPNVYVAKGKPFKPPPVRLLMLGPRGAGKSLHGRHLAEELGIFHIDFRERLQELIIGKTKKKIGPEFEDEEEEPDSDNEEENAEVKDGEKVEETSPEESKPEETGEQEAEEEEEPEAELTEEEENIKGNLMGEEALSLETVEKIASDWWNKEPFKTTGFVLEGFPRTVEEAQFMADKGLFPDAAIVLAVDDGEITNRLLPPKMEKWKQKRDKKLAKREKKKEKKRKERDAAMNKRRLELQQEMAEKKAEKMAQKAAEKDSDESDASDNDEDEEEEEDDVEALLAEEFEEEEEEEEDDDEMEEDAEDRLRNEIGEMYDDDTNRLASVQETLEEILIPRMELDGGRKPHIVRYTLKQTLQPVVECRESLFEKVYPIKEHVAQKMLQIGYKHPSRFGRWCPVKLLAKDCIQPMQGVGFPSFPVQYRQNVFFLSTQEDRDSFLLNPLKYLRQPSPKPVVPTKMAIIGPPKCGKTTLANRFVAEYGMMRLSIGEAVRFVLNQQSQTELANQINSHLQKGAVIPDELAVRALEVTMLDSKANTRGYILDGYPVTKTQVDLLTEYNIIPVVILELQVDSRELMVRGMKDRHSPLRTLPLHDSAQIMAIRIAAWQKEVTGVREWYKEEHSNWVAADGERSKWWVWNEAVKEGKKSVMRIQDYLQRIADGKAVSIADLCITPKEFLSRLGDFGQYCPVSLARTGELVDCSTARSLDLAAEFRGRYYKLENQEKRDEFLAHPEQYVPPLAPRRLPSPDLLPKRRTPLEVKTMFPMRLELQGYCSVTYLDGKLRYEALIPGNTELVVEYREKLYCFEDLKKLHKFMRLPEKYYNLKLPHKLPPRKDPLMVTSLPMLGYMEQTLSTAITKAMTAAGLFKPKFPFLSVSRSALIYVAFHLKAYNPKSSDYVRKKYKRKLQQFEEHCELIAYLGNNMSQRYREPGERPIDFDHKMVTFLNLEGIEPTPTWVA